jgi:CBS domain-containing protein
MSIQNILDRKGADVFTIEPTATVRTAAYLMRARGIAALVVKSGDVISGLISERDVAHAIAQHGDRALSMAASDVMTRSAITVTPGDTLRRAMTLMTNHRVRHLIVMANGHLVGIVSIGDVVKYRLEDLEAESNVLRDAYIAAHRDVTVSHQRDVPTPCGQQQEEGHVDSNWATCCPQNRPAFLYGNGVGLGAYVVPRIFAELLPSRYRASFAYTTVSAARGFFYGMGCAAGCSNRSGGGKSHRHPPYPGRCGSCLGCVRVGRRRCRIGRDAKAQWRAAGR